MVKSYYFLELYDLSWQCQLGSKKWRKATIRKSHAICNRVLILEFVLLKKRMQITKMNSGLLNVNYPMSFPRMTIR